MDHHARVMDRLADGFEREPSVAHNGAEGDGGGVGGEDALDGERDAEHLAVLLFDVGGEVVDDAADTLVVNVGVAVRQGIVAFFDDVAVQVNRAQAQFVGPHHYPDGSAMIGIELIILRLAPAGGILQFAFADESVIF